VVAGCLLTARSASAEVTLLKNDSWEVYTGGRVNVFFGYAFGDGFPVSQSTGGAVGGGVDSASDLIPKLNAAGMPDTTQQGTISKMRLRSGFVPNVLTLGVRKKVNDTTTLKGQVSLWGTIETTGQRKFVNVTADWREGFLEIDGPWGTVTGGRFLSLFSRGITETDFMYLHGYGVGFWGGSGLYNPGPTAGLIGFGVLAAFFSPGIMYTTPNLSGLKVALGVFDPVSLPGSWDTTRTPRPEGEATYDVTAGTFKAHIFANGTYQKVYLNSKSDNDTVIGAGYGARLEYGPFHVGGGGHYGKGLGLYYALEGGLAAAAGGWNSTPDLRTFDGYSVFAQYAPGQFDINLGYGVSKVHLLEIDKLPNHDESLIHSQTGIAAAFVYHATDNIHLDLDYLNAHFAWYRGEKQVVNYVNTGVTMTW
jgi:Gram-negative porin